MHASPARETDMRAALVVGLVTCSAAGAIFGQINARQGTDLDTPNEFKSPMVLDLPFPDPAKLQFDIRHAYAGTQRLFCDDVSVQTFNLTAFRTRKRAKAIVLQVDGTLFVRSSHDRRVDLEFIIHAEGVVIARTKLSNIDAEEKKVGVFKKSLAVEKEKLAQAAATGDVLLRVIVTVRDD
jgi:hypothetical protein